MLRTVSAVAFLTASIVAPTLPRTPLAIKPAVVTIHAKEFAFLAPKSIPAGTTTFRLVNDGKQLHHLSIMKLDNGKTIADFMNAMKKPGPPPAWETDVGGPNPALPGHSASATLTLEAGNYIIACFIPSPGEETPHMMKGMILPLTVTPVGDVTQAGAPMATKAVEPTPDLHLTVADYSFKFSKPLTAGHHVIHVMNAGPQPHEVIFLQLAPGKTVQDFATWAGTGMKGPPPGKPIDGMAGFSKGRTGTFEADITPGEYGLLCLVPDAKDGKVHAEHGMMRQFTVAAK